MIIKEEEMVERKANRAERRRMDKEVRAEHRKYLRLKKLKNPKPQRQAWIGAYEKANGIK